MSMSSTPTAGSIEVEGDQLVFDVRGEGAPLLLIPGTPADASVFSLIVEPLAQDYTVITYDPRGFGRSSGREPKLYEIGQQARDAVAVLVAAGHQRALIMGTSAGAVASLELAKNHPSVIEGLIAHEPPVVRVLPEAEELQTRIAEFYEMAWTKGAKAAFLQFLEFSQLPANNGQPFTKEEVEQLLPIVDTLPGFDTAEFYMRYQVLALTNYPPALDAIKQNGVRVVMAAGELSHDRLFGRTARAIAEHLGRPFVTFPGHHGSYLDPASAEAWVSTLHDAIRAL